MKHKRRRRKTSAEKEKKLAGESGRRAGRLLCALHGKSGKEKDVRGGGRHGRTWRGSSAAHALTIYARSNALREAASDARFNNAGQHIYNTPRLPAAASACSAITRVRAAATCCYLPDSKRSTAHSQHMALSHLADLVRGYTRSILYRLLPTVGAYVTRAAYARKRQAIFAAYDASSRSLA